MFEGMCHNEKWNVDGGGGLVQESVGSWVVLGCVGEDYCSTVISPTVVCGEWPFLSRNIAKY